MITLHSIAELISTEAGHEVLFRRMEAAKQEIDAIAVSIKGITLVHNLQYWTQIEAIPIICDGINRHENGTKEYWRPYND